MAWTIWTYVLIFGCGPRPLEAHRWNEFLELKWAWIPSTILTIYIYIYIEQPNKRTRERKFWSLLNKFLEFLQAFKFLQIFSTSLMNSNISTIACYTLINKSSSFHGGCLRLNRLNYVNILFNKNNPYQIIISVLWSTFNKWYQRHSYCAWRERERERDLEIGILLVDYVYK